jgi:hypothetical protein
MLDRRRGEKQATHESIVAFPSLPNIRLSELVVSLKPTTKGFCVVPEIYSVALNKRYYCETLDIADYSHVIVEMNVGRIEVLYRLGIIWVV